MSVTRDPAALGCSPCVSISVPAADASAPSAMIASISPGGGWVSVTADLSSTR